MAQNTKGLKGQGHTSRSSVKVTQISHCTPHASHKYAQEV